MNETIGQIGGSNDRRRRVKISKKMLQNLKERYKLIQKRKFEELEKKVKILQIITFFKSLAIILPTEQIKQIITRKKEEKKDNELFTIKEVPRFIKKDLKNKKEDKVVIDLFKKQEKEEKKEEQIEVLYIPHMGISKEEKEEAKEIIPNSVEESVKNDEEVEIKEEIVEYNDIDEIISPHMVGIEKEDISDTYEILDVEEKEQPQELEEEKEEIKEKEKDELIEENKEVEDKGEDDSYYEKILLKMDEMINKASKLSTRVFSSVVIDCDDYTLLIDKYKQDFKDIVDIDDLKHSEYYKELRHKKEKFEDIIKKTKYELNEKHHSYKKSEEKKEKAVYNKTSENKEKKEAKENKKLKKKNPLIMFLYGYSSMLLFTMLKNKGDSSILGSRTLAISLLVSIYIANHVNDRNYDLKQIEEYKKALEEEARDVYGVLRQIERSLIEVENQIVTVEQEKEHDDPYYDMTLNNLYAVRDDLVTRRTRILEQLTLRKEHINVKKI